MPKRTDISSILIIGAGPIVIGQACEFDYSGTQAVKALKEEGYRIILVNSNPATIMTDPDMAHRTYVEPITPEVVAKIIEKERPDALLPTMGGQTALNCALSLKKMGVLEKYNVEMIGATAEAIDKAEDRELFRNAMTKIGLDTPRSHQIKTLPQALEALADIGLPAAATITGLVDRPDIGGQFGMAVTQGVDQIGLPGQLGVEEKAAPVLAAIGAVEQQPRLTGDPALIPLEIDADQAEVLLLGQVEGPLFPAGSPVVGLKNQAVAAHQEAVVPIGEGHIQGIGAGVQGHRLPGAGTGRGQAGGDAATESEPQAGHQQEAEQGGEQSRQGGAQGRHGGSPSRDC